MTDKKTPAKAADTKAAAPKTNELTNTTAAAAEPQPADTKKAKAEDVPTGNDGTPIGGPEQDKGLAARLETMTDQNVTPKAGGQMDAVSGR